MRKAKWGCMVVFIRESSLAFPHPPSLSSLAFPLFSHSSMFDPFACFPIMKFSISLLYPFSFTSLFSPPPIPTAYLPLYLLPTPSCPAARLRCWPWTVKWLALGSPGSPVCWQGEPSSEWSTMNVCGMDGNFHWQALTVTYYKRLSTFCVIAMCL